jgi:flavin prenyltransferase
VSRPQVLIAITGASGSVYGLRLLEKLARRPEVDTHLVVSRSGEKTLHLETGKLLAEVRQLARYSYSNEEIGAKLASGSFQSHSMVIAPCSIHTMSAIATGNTNNLITRAADVMLKERRRLVMMIREMPFHLGHLRNMTALAEMGAIVAPPVPAFYHQPKSVEEIVDHSVDRVLDLIQLPDDNASRWQGK